MRFYELPATMQTKINDKNIRPYAIIHLGQKIVPLNDIIECDITNYKSSDGGIRTAGTIILDNTENEYSPTFDENLKPNLEVKIFYGLEKETFHRFTLYVDSKGFQNEQTGHNTKITTIKLVDLSDILNDDKTQSEWNTTNTFVNCKIADSENKETSLIHLLTKRSGITDLEVETCELPFNVHYVNTSKSTWKELCELALAYNTRLECTKDKKLSFIESKYDGTEKDTTSDFTLTRNEITHFRRYDNFENYSNDIRLKYTRYTKGKRQELWNYSDSPYWYDSENKIYYPFSDDSREILTNASYEAEYTAVNSDGNPRTVVYAEDLDDEKTFLENMKVAGTEKLQIVKYDTKTNKQKAYIQLNRNGKNINLYKMAIYGTPILSEPNFCVYTKNEEEIKKFGIRSLNLTNHYLSDDEYNGKPIYKHFAENKLEELSKLRNNYFVKTNYALINSRVGAYLNLEIDEKHKTQIEEINFRYKKNYAFETCLWLKEV